MDQQCSIFGKCGGCDIQHLPYEEQIKKKVERIEQSLKFKSSFIEKSQPYGYRNRIECIIRNNKICMREKNSATKYIELQTCLIASPKIQHLIEEMRNLITLNQTLDWQNTIKQIIFRSTNAGDTGIYIEFNQGEDDIAKIIKLKTQHCTQPFPTLTAKNIAYGICEENKEYPDKLIAIKGNTYLKETLNTKTYYFAINGFFQNNSLGAEQMLNYVYTLFQNNQHHLNQQINSSTQNATLIDLYGGVGTFGIYCASLFKHTHIVEGVPPAIAHAKENIQLNNITSATAHCLDAKQLDRIKISGPTYCILDPPRVGMDIRAITNVRNLKPESIIYISCNPQQLAKDIPKFKEYTLTHLGIFDMFAQTNHVEVIVELTRK